MTGRIVLAPDSFKGSIGAADACAALAEGWRSVDPDAQLVPRPMADGGEGTLEAFAAAVPGAVRMPVVVTGADGQAVEASWLLLPPDADTPRGRTAVVELASTSGIELLGEQRLPWDADTTGFGQAIAAALDHGVSRLVLGIGSSASTDGGVGMLRALGARFTDAAGMAVAPGAWGLQCLAAADLSGLRPLPAGGVLVLSDVTNPLCGPAGAAAVFGPQKGFAEGEIAAVDAVLAHLADVLADAVGAAGGGLTGAPVGHAEGGRSAAPGSVASVVTEAGTAAPATRASSDPVAPGADSAGRAAPGAGAGDPAASGSGAAGGTGFALRACTADPAASGAGAAGGTGFALRVWGARLVPGSAEVAQLTGLAGALADAHAVVTGEGSYDGQSAAGKAPARVAALAAAVGVPVMLVAGRIADDADLAPFAASVSLTDLAGSAAGSLADPARWLRAAGAALAAQA